MLSRLASWRPSRPAPSHPQLVNLETLRSRYEASSQRVRETMVPIREARQLLHKINSCRHPDEEPSVRAAYTTFPNQDEVAEKLFNKLMEHDIVGVMLIAEPQWGKTGVMLALIELLALNCETTGLGANNMLVITGLSSVDWKNQTRFRVPSNVAVYGRADLQGTNVGNRFYDHVKALIDDDQPVVMFIDETHIASNDTQTLRSAFEALGLTSHAAFITHRVRLVTISATPGQVLSSVFGANHTVQHGWALVTPPPCTSYTSLIDINNNGHMMEYHDICGYRKDGVTPTHPASVTDARKHIADMMTRSVVDRGISQGIIFFRIKGTGRGQGTINNVRHVITTEFANANTNTFDNISYHSYIGGTETVDGVEPIDDIVEFFDRVPPPGIRVVFVKEKLRVANTISTRNIVVWYERFSPGINDSTVIQATGRVAGHGVDWRRIHVYTRIESVVQYGLLLDAWRSGVDWRDIQWFSGVKRKQFIASGEADSDSDTDTDSDSGTGVDTSVVTDFCVVYAINDPTDDWPRLADEVKTGPVSNIMRSSTVGGSGRRPLRSNKRQPNPTDNRYYGTVRGKTRIYTVAEIRDQKSSAHARDTPGAHLQPAYDTDGRLVWCVCARVLTADVDVIAQFAALEARGVVELT